MNSEFGNRGTCSDVNFTAEATSGVDARCGLAASEAHAAIIGGVGPWGGKA